MPPARRRPGSPDASTLIWIDKAMGLVVPGFVPTPIGEVFDYTPTRVETLVSAGIWAVGSLVVAGLLKIAIPIQHGTLRWPGRSLPRRRWTNASTTAGLTDRAPRL